MNCPWCGGSEIDHDVAQVITAPYIVAQFGGGNLPMATVSLFSKCKCGLMFQEHRQTDEWYNWFYSSGTYRQTLGISQEEMDIDEKKRAVEITEWLSLLENPLSINQHSDIGSSRGYFLEQISKTFKCAVSSGFDPNKDYRVVEYIKRARAKEPDFVSAIHVLEHTIDPIEELTRWAQMTTKYLLVEVPGMKTLGGPLRFAHLYYFPQELLKDKIIELGFGIVKMETEPNTRILAERENQYK